MSLDYWMAVQVWQLLAGALGAFTAGMCFAYLILTGAFERRNHP